MEILVIGGAGFIGGAIIKHYLDNNSKDHKITVLDSLLYEDEYFQPIDYIYEDVRNKKVIKSIIKDYDVIILLAAIVGDAACQANPLTAVEVNEDFAKWLGKNYSGKIIFTSTCSVYGTNDEIINENSEIRPLSLYAKMKANVEAEYLKRKNTIVFRLATLFGTAIRPRFDLVINTLTSHAVINKHVRVFGGNQWRPNCHVMDAGEWILKSALGDYESGIYNLSTFNCRIIDIGDYIHQKYQDIKYEVTSSKYEDNRNYKVSTKKAEELLGFKAKYTLADGVQEVEDLIKSGRIKNIFANKYHNARMLQITNKEK